MSVLDHCSVVRKNSESVCFLDYHSHGKSGGCDGLLRFGHGKSVKSWNISEFFENHRTGERKSREFLSSYEGYFSLYSKPFG